MLRVTSRPKSAPFSREAVLVRTTGFWWTSHALLSVPDRNHHTDKGNRPRQVPSWRTPGHAQPSVKDRTLRVPGTDLMSESARTWYELPPQCPEVEHRRSR